MVASIRFLLTLLLCVGSVAFFSVMAKDIRVNSIAPGEMDPTAKSGDKIHDTTLVDDRLECKGREKVFKKMKCVPQSQPVQHCDHYAPILECHEKAPALKCASGEKPVPDMKCL